MKFNIGDKVLGKPSTRTNEEYPTLYDKIEPATIEQIGDSLAVCRSHDGIIFSCYIERLVLSNSKNIFEDGDFCL